eukprot:TRINITY_DN2782_c0_g1_i1.p1 TRINITY_DN2782_c0_g1~~TRINITY_DN2782_c0_g1_i1.p1  ORF type:complete len:1237 (+),score=666.00 TRINITY_DN2782_c0_g1_i1:202-3912(+)
MVHIKKVLIQGFKSYKDQSEFEDFDQRVNVIVAPNGSGKSNFFSAIRFVLGDHMQNLRPEYLRSLLHEGSGENVMSAYVEIVFDNKDQRFPTEKDEVVLRRSIGVKKDEYTLDRRRVTKHDVQNLLESAGFSRSNPYYIVQQGKVADVTNMRDADRLELLKDIAGTKVYDERRDESVRIMADSDAKRQNIADTLAYIEQRLGELDAERDELRQYQQLDRDRRACEFTIYDKDLQQTAAQLTEIDAERADEAKKSVNVHREWEEAHEQLVQAERSVGTLQAQLAAQTAERADRHAERHELVADRARLDLQVKHSEERLKRDEARHKQLDDELAELGKQLTRQQAELDAIRPKFDEQLVNERQLNEELASVERRIAELYAKQGRTAQFKSKKERDTFLRGEIKAIETQLTAKRAQLATVQEETDAVRRTIDQHTADKEQIGNNLEQRKKQVEQRTRDYQELIGRRDELANTRKEKWREEQAVLSELQQHKERLSEAERHLFSSVNPTLSRGLLGIKRLTQEHGIEGVYGPLIELFECPDAFTTAVEVVAGGSLFHIVVDTDDTASHLIELVNKEKLGRVTFIPLNRVVGKTADVPESPDSKPMLSVLKFNPLYRKAFAQVFGKTWICRDLDVATTLSKQHGVDTITLEGDQVHRRGAITGGFHDARQSRLDAMRAVTRGRVAYDNTSATAGKLNKALSELDNSVTQLLGELHKADGQRMQARDAIDELSLQLKTLSRQISSNQQLLEPKEAAAASLQVSVKELDESIKALQAELGSELLGRLSDAEQAELVRLNGRLEELRRLLRAASASRTELEARRDALGNMLSNNLRKRHDELADETERLRLEEQRAQLSEARTALGTVASQIDAVAAAVKQADDQVTATEKKLHQERLQIDELRTKENEKTKQRQNESAQMERLLSQKALLLTKRDELERKMRETGSVPAAALDKLKSRSVKQLLKLLHETGTKLKAFAHVNKKAADQFVAFTEQRDSLLERQKELDASKASIEELMQALDKKKDEAIERTFKGVLKAFTQVFAALVPGGMAKLAMTKRGGPAPADAESTPDGPASEDGRGSTVARYDGIAVRVSFSGAEEPRPMSQLSGGQKSLVALALIFAIQRCDPAPFYLFDEIDSALDPTYRSAVAKMIRAQSKHADFPAQFICTTFRPELVQAAHRWYGITHRVKESKIHTITKVEALKIIQEEISDPSQSQAMMEISAEEEVSEEGEEAAEEWTAAE